jgi:hypothetical protein
MQSIKIMSGRKPAGCGGHLASSGWLFPEAPQVGRIKSVYTIVVPYMIVFLD